MYLTRHATAHGSQWAVDGQLVPAGVTLASLLADLEALVPHALVKAARQFGIHSSCLRRPCQQQGRVVVSSMHIQQQ